MSANDPNRTSALARIGNSFYFHQHFRLRKGPDFNKRGSWKISGEELAARSPDLSVFLDIDYVDRHLYQDVHRSPGRLDDAINAGKYLRGLFVLIFADYLGAAFKGTCYLTGDEQHAACAYGV